MLGLIRSVSGRYVSVRGDGRVQKEIRERIAGSEAGRHAFGVTVGQTLEQGEHSAPDGPFGWRCWVWYADEFQWRRELELPDG